MGGKLYRKIRKYHESQEVGSKGGSCDQEGIFKELSWPLATSYFFFFLPSDGYMNACFLKQMNILGVY